MPTTNKKGRDGQAATPKKHNLGKLYFYLDSKSEWRWAIRKRGRAIGASTEGYKKLRAAAENLYSIRLATTSNVTYIMGVRLPIIDADDVKQQRKIFADKILTLQKSSPAGMVILPDPVY